MSQKTKFEVESNEASQPLVYIAIMISVPVLCTIERGCIKGMPTESNINHQGVVRSIIMRKHLTRVGLVVACVGQST